MSKRHTRREGRNPEKRVECCGKTTYPTQGRALNALHHIQVQSAQAVVPPDVVPNDVYKCLHGNWHLTAGKGILVDG